MQKKLRTPKEGRSHGGGVGLRVTLGPHRAEDSGWLIAGFFEVSRGGVHLASWLGTITHPSPDQLSLGSQLGGHVSKESTM